MDVDLVLFESNLAVCMPAGASPSSDVIPIPEGESSFRMKGGMINGEPVVFEADDAGRITRRRGGSYVLERKRESVGIG
jgi:hypothetical protein